MIPGSYDDGYLKNIDALATIIRDKIRRRISEARAGIFPHVIEDSKQRGHYPERRIQEVVMANVEEYFP